MFSFRSSSSSILESEFFPPIKTEGGGWEIALISFASVNSIPNVRRGENELHFWTSTPEFRRTPTPAMGKSKGLSIFDEDEEKADDIASIKQRIDELDSIIVKKSQEAARQQTTKRQTEQQFLTSITIPPGNYELHTLRHLIKSELWKRGVRFVSRVNKTTLQIEIAASHQLDFIQENSIGPVLGFSSTRLLVPNKFNKSDIPPRISGLNVLRIECNIVSGSYTNGIEDHILFEFPIDVDPGYKLQSIPSTPVYLPVNTQRIDHIVLRIIDEFGRLVDFAGETINIRLHLKRRDGSQL
jgi:hypothetical protein